MRSSSNAAVEAADSEPFDADGPGPKFIESRTPPLSLTSIEPGAPVTETNTRDLGSAEDVAEMARPLALVLSVQETVAKLLASADMAYRADRGGIVASGKCIRSKDADDRDAADDARSASTAPIARELVTSGSSSLTALSPEVSLIDALEKRT